MDQGIGTTEEEEPGAFQIRMAKIECLIGLFCCKFEKLSANGKSIMLPQEEGIIVVNILPIKSL